MKNFFSRKAKSVVQLKISREDLRLLANDVSRRIQLSSSEWQQVLSSIKCLPRILAAAGVKEDKLIRLAIKWYLNACDDVARVETENEENAGTIPTDFVVRLRRERNERRYLLEQLGVDVHDSKEGDILKRELFKVDSSVPTHDPSEHSRIAEFIQPAFTWILNDQACLEPGRVSTFLLTDDAIEKVAETALLTDKAFTEEVVTS